MSWELDRRHSTEQHGANKVIGSHLIALRFITSVRTEITRFPLFKKVDQRGDVFRQVYRHEYINMCIDMCTDVVVDMCMDMRLDMRLDICMDMCTDMCIAMYKHEVVLIERRRCIQASALPRWPV